MNPTILQRARCVLLWILWPVKPNSQKTFADVDQSDAADALLRMASADASTFKPDKKLHDEAKSMETYR
jgi:hypothetical protein